MQNRTEIVQGWKNMDVGIIGGSNVIRFPMRSTDPDTEQFCSTAMEVADTENHTPFQNILSDPESQFDMHTPDYFLLVE